MRRLAIVAAVVVAAAAVPGAAVSVVRDVAPDQTVEATDATGAVVTFDASLAALTCTPASGSTFAIGTTPVSCTDGTTTTTFNVIVQDTTPPTIDAPAATTYEAAGPTGATVAYTSPAAHDLVDGDLATNCTPLPGMLFPIGSTDVTCTATDAHGNSSQLVFPVVVADTTPPVLTVPADLTVQASSDAGVPIANAAVTAFLTAAVANDIVSGRVDVNSDAPQVLPIGTTVVTFTAADGAGNVAHASAKATVLAPAAPPPPPQPVVDRTPPDDVKNLSVGAGDSVVRLSWTAPNAPDFDHVVVTRTTLDGANAVPVYTGTGTTFVDHDVANDVGYRYVVVAYDAAGNRSAGAVATATPRAPLLLTPLDGARVTGPPVLVWAPVPQASYYNVQLFRGTQKVLSAWPRKTSLKLHARWRYAGHRYALAAGAYHWYVWPGFGPRAKARYGPLLGQSAFVVNK